MLLMLVSKEELKLGEMKSSYQQFKALSQAALKSASKIAKFELLLAPLINSDQALSSTYNSLLVDNSLVKKI